MQRMYEDAARELLGLDLQALLGRKLLNIWGSSQFGVPWGPAKISGYYML